MPAGRKSPGVYITDVVYHSDALQRAQSAAGEQRPPDGRPHQRLGPVVRSGRARPVVANDYVVEYDADAGQQARVGRDRERHYVLDQPDHADGHDKQRGDGRIPTDGLTVHELRPRIVRPVGRILVDDLKHDAEGSVL